jgi:glycosyltransferase involved in cell wall biosynthesis
MRILYASCRYDPFDRDAGSGVDFNMYEAFQQIGVELTHLGPFKDHRSLPEKLYRKAHRLFSRKLAAKFSEAYLRSCARIVDESAAREQPDAIFTHNLIPLVYSRSRIPVIYKTDAILSNMHEQWPTYSRFELRRMLRWERKALNRATLIVTVSEWARQALLEDYHIPEKRMVVMPIPSSLPADCIPEKVDEKTISPTELHLLSVARDFNLKGTEISIAITKILRAKGINAQLRVVGQNGDNSDGVEYMGLYKKANPEMLREYISQYQWAHLLIHPARYEAAGIVCSEAAALGVPTITNAAGGLATTVKDGVSGIVLPRGSAAETYVSAIEGLLEDPHKYQQMSRSARERYAHELNWRSMASNILVAFASLQASIKQG